MRHLLAFLTMVLGAVSVHASPARLGDFPISDSSALQGQPSIAYDAKRDRFLSTWLDLRNDLTSGIDVYGRFVDGNGRPVSADIPITRAKGSQGFSAIAFDPINDRFLVVWTDWRDAQDIDSDIYGLLVNADGTPYGEEFPIAVGRKISKKFPNLAFDPVRQRFLVLWVDDRNDKVDKIYGRYVSAGGDLQGAAFAVALKGNYQDSPSLLFDVARDRFFVAWRDTRSIAPGDLEKAVYGSFVHAERGPSGSSFLIAQEKYGCVPLSLYATDFAPGEDYYFIAWSSGRNYNEWVQPKGEKRRQRGLDVYGAFVGAEDGSLSKPPFMIASEIDYQKAPSVAYDPKQSRFLVVWYDLRRAPTALDMDIYGRFVSTAGSLSDEFLISDPGARGLRRFPAVSFSPKSGTFLVLWEDGRNRPTVGRQIFGTVQR